LPTYVIKEVIAIAGEGIRQREVSSAIRIRTIENTRNEGLVKWLTNQKDGYRS
jgi:hypothetical protein